jgi:hypothetical protein
VNHDQIESAIDDAISALGAAKLALSKSALPIFNERDILRKAFLGDDPATRASTSKPLSISESAALVKSTLDAIADLNARPDLLAAR